MKNLKLLFVGIAVLSILTACGNDNKTADVKHYGVEAKCVSFENLEEMETYSDLIVKGVRLEGEEAIITTVDGNIVSGYSFSQFQISEIYQDSSNTYQIGDTITILENEVYDEANNVVYHIAGYNMMEEGEEYLLFLQHAQTDGKGYFVASGVNYGTISLTVDDRQRAYTTETGMEVVDYNIYQEIWSDALDKYIN